MIKANIRRNAQRFADHTSIDGVHEAYYAKTWFWKILWFLVVVTAVVLTLFQVIKTLIQYVKMDNLTIITPAKEEEIKYPAIRLCFLHWVYWVDWRKVEVLNFSKPSALYGLSFITKGFSSENFDVETARVEFLRTLKLHNMSRLMEFYAAISADIMTLEPDDIDGSYFEERELIYKYPNLMFCYTVPKIKVYEILKQQANLATSSANGLILKFTLFDAKYEHLNKTFVTLDEYNYHIAFYLKKVFQYEMKSDDFRETVLPPLVYPNAYGTDRMQIWPENNAYSASFRVTAHRKKNSTEWPCLERQSTVLPDDTCFRKCHIDYFLSKCTCLYLDNAVYVGKDYTETLCPETISFLPMENSTNSENLMQACDVQVPGYLENDKICVKNCLPACETWSYECTITVEPTPNYGQSFRNGKNRTKITIKYPNTGDILLLTETDPWTWQDLVGNIGGLLGIWTGASVISLIQLVYLCCCSDNHEDLFKKRNFLSTTITNVINVQKIGN